MADVPGKFFSAKKVRTGVSPSSPGVIEGEVLPPVNPPGSSLAEYVTYTGATGNVDLGEYGIDAGFVNLDTTPTGTPTTQGTIFWDADDETVDIVLNGYTMKIGEDLFYPVKNQTGSTIAKGVAVRFAGTLGASGRLLIEPFIANGTVPSSRFMGVTAEEILNGEDGKVLYFGRVRGINTDAFNEGDILYASTTVAGGYQTAIPLPPNNIVQVAAVISKSPTVGTIFVRPTLGSNINTDEGVKITSVADKNLLQYQSGTALWENKTLAQVLGGTSLQFVKGDGSLDSTTYVPTSRQVVAGAGLAGGGALTSNVTLSHADTSSQSSVNNSNGNVIQDITLDTYGHITALGSINLDSRYYTESEIDATLTNYQLLSAKGQPNGYAGLDSNGKVPLAQINDALIGNVNFQGLWNAATNTPTLANPPASGTKGYYYIVSTGGTFAGITFEVGDWIISNGTSWGKVDNTDAVSSVFGRTGNVVAANGDYNTSQVTESGNLYYTEARVNANANVAANTAARHAAVTLGTANGLSLNVQQLSLALASGSTTGALSSANWTTFNNKENAITAGTTAQYFRGDKTFQTLNTGVVPESGNLYFTNARSIASVLTGYTSGAGTISAADSILTAIQKLNGNIGALVTGVSSVNGQTGAVTLTTTNIGEGTNLYFTNTRARAALSFAAGSGAYNTTTGVITIPTDNNQIANGANYITAAALSAYLPLAGGTMTGAITTPNGTFGIVIGDDSRLADRNVANTLFIEGVQNNDRGYINFSQTSGNALGSVNGGDLTWRGNVVLHAANFNSYAPTLGGTGATGTWSIAITGNAGTANTWTTARTITIGNTGKSVNGSANVAWSLAEIGAYAATNPSAFIALTALSGVAPIQYNNTTGAISITQASGSTNGFLSSTDWNTFNNKQNALTNPVTGTGTTNYLPKFTGSTTIGNSIFTEVGGNTLRIIAANATLRLTGSREYLLQTVDADGRFRIYDQTAALERVTLTSTGNVGIGITPASTVLLDLKEPDAATDLIIGLSAGTGARSQIRSIAQALGSTSELSFHTVSANVTGERMRIFSDGNVGINTGATNNGARLQVKMSNDGLLSFLEAGTSSVAVKSSGSLVMEANPLSNFIFRGFDVGAGVTEKMRITSSGNVLIGSPPAADNGARLQVSGAAYFSSNVRINGNDLDLNNGSVLHRITNDNTNLLIRADYGNDSPNSTIQFSIDGTTRMRITSSGNVGIGTDDVEETLTVAKVGGGDGTVAGFRSAATFSQFEIETKESQVSWGLNTVGGRNMYFSTNGSERLRITSTGNVLIGTTTDNGNKLRVNGNSWFDGEVAVNAITCTSGNTNTYINPIGTLGIIYSGQGTSAVHQFLVNSGERFAVTNSGIRTIAPSVGNAANWKLGDAITITTSATRSIRVEIAGTMYYLLAYT